MINTTNKGDTAMDTVTIELDGHMETIYDDRNEYGDYETVAESDKTKGTNTMDTTKTTLGIAIARCDRREQELEMSLIRLEAAQSDFKVALEHVKIDREFVRQEALRTKGAQ